MYIETLQTLVTAVPAIDNPIDGVVPDFTVFGGEFNTWWKKLFGAIWAICIIWALVQLVIALTGMANARQGSHPGQLQESRNSAIWAGGALAALAAFGVLVGAILTVAG